MENNNQQMQFKTNINCGGCVASVKAHLDLVKGIVHWEVDTTDKDKVLTVTLDGITSQEIMDQVKSAGFTITPLG